MLLKGKVVIALTNSNTVPRFFVVFEAKQKRRTK